MPENIQEEEFINFYEEIPVDDPEPDADPDPEPGDDDPDKVDPSDDDPETGDEGGDDDKPIEGEKPKTKKDPRDQPVPFSRYQKTLNDKKRLERELAEARAGKPAADKVDPDADDDDGAEDEPELDERSRKAVDKFIKDNGYVTRAEIDKEKNLTKMREQVEQDTKELTTFAEENGYPSPNVVELDEWADENLGKDFIKNAKSLKAAYYAKYADDIREQDRKAALADAASGNATGERPGAAAKTTPVDEVPEGRGFLKGAIHKARKEIDAGQ